jgi:hypothetical protein
MVNFMALFIRTIHNFNQLAWRGLVIEPMLNSLFNSG